MGAKARIGAADGDVPSDDVEVVPTSGARASRDEEFAAFMTGSQGDLLRTAWLLVGDAHRAEELAQESLARTYAAWSRARRDPLAYTRRVLVNLRTDAWRRRRREVLMAPDRVPDRASADDGAVEHRDQLSRRSVCSRPASAAWWCCATCSTCPRPRSPPTSGSRSGR